MIDRMVELKERRRNAEKEGAKEIREHHAAIRERVCCAQPGHVLAAIESQAREGNNDTIEDFANLIDGYRDRNDVHREFDDAARTKIAELVTEMG